MNRSLFRKPFTVSHAIVALLAITVMLASCTPQSPAEKARLTIVASFYPVYIIARNVTANVPGVQVVNLTPPVTGCLHDYSLTTEDMKRLEGADVLLLNGAGMESFTAKIREKYPQLKTATLTDGIKLITHDDHTNPHAWVGISGALAMTANCANALAAIDTEHAAAYRANAQAYTAQLNALKKEMSDRLNRFRGKKIITFHEAFPYFAEEFGLTIAAVIQREPGSEPSPKEIAATIELIKKHRITALFAEPQYPSNAADIIARETGLKVYYLDPAATGDDSPDAYLRAMRKNLAAMEAALQ